ncbi:MAG TPA: hypothetical protein PKA34_24180 [Blastocatellia bacterium]|nr:hypothetical protein [Blastocatellia bacterium]
MSKMINSRHFILSGWPILPVFLWLTILNHQVFAQRPYTVEKPPVRPASEKVTIRTRPAQATKGVLAVVLDPKINGQVTVKDPTGRVLAKQDADKDGQVEFQLQRGKSYQVEAEYPGYRGTIGKSRPLKSSEVIRLKLVPEYAKLVLKDLPVGSQVLIDNQLRATADQTGIATINDLPLGDHSLLVRHSEYNDYANKLSKLEAGDVVDWRIPLVRVAKLTVQGPSGATVFIDGAIQGKIRDDGTVRIDYELSQIIERTISVELLGYQSWSQKEVLKPGPRTITVKLDPVVTSAAVTEFFDSLSRWKAPSSWELVGDARNKKLRIKGTELGILKDAIYRDIQSVTFTVWLDDAIGATWAVKADKEGRNYYLFHLAGPKSTTHTPKRFYTYLVRDGGTPEEVNTPTPFLTELSQGGSYTITMEVIGHKIQHWITSNVTGQKDDLGFWVDGGILKEKFLYGYFGFRSLAGEVFTVDDLFLEPATTQ